MLGGAHEPWIDHLPAEPVIVPASARTATVRPARARPPARRSARRAATSACATARWTRSVPTCSTQAATHSPARRARKVCATRASRPAGEAEYNPYRVDRPVPEEKPLVHARRIGSHKERLCPRRQTWRQAGYGFHLRAPKAGSERELRAGDPQAPPTSRAKTRNPAGKDPQPGRCPELTTLPSTTRLMSRTATLRPGAGPRVLRHRATLGSEHRVARPRHRLLDGPRNPSAIRGWRSSN